MKYKEQDYLDSNFYSDDEEIQNHTQKIVKCRKPHKCVGGCESTIQVGENALFEKGFMDNSLVTCYTCIPCLDKWLDEIIMDNADCES